MTTIKKLAYPIFWIATFSLGYMSFGFLHQKATVPTSDQNSQKQFVGSRLSGPLIRVTNQVFGKVVVVNGKEMTVEKDGERMTLRINASARLIRRADQPTPPSSKEKGASVAPRGESSPAVSEVQDIEEFSSIPVGSLVTVDLIMLSDGSFATEQVVFDSDQR